MRSLLTAGYWPTTRAKDLCRQQQERQHVPAGVWGSNELRRTLAAKIADIVQNEVGWPNAFFIPEDPFRIMLFRVQSDGLCQDLMEAEATFMRIEEATGIDIYERCGWDKLEAMSFGEVVDFLVNEMTQGNRARTS